MATVSPANSKRLSQPPRTSSGVSTGGVAAYGRSSHPRGAYSTAADNRFRTRPVTRLLPTETAAPSPTGVRWLDCRSGSSSTRSGTGPVRNSCEAPDCAKRSPKPMRTGLLSALKPCVRGAGSPRTRIGMRPRSAATRCGDCSGSGCSRSAAADQHRGARSPGDQTDHKEAKAYP